ncbi:SixA phosphatase family protein [Flavihumibacter petaseus]|nr:phosphoglycerate mutase family protein [Flavihumibacter petaseus]
MLSRLVVFALVVMITGCTHKYYIVRHGEKAVTQNADAQTAKDPALSEAGTDRAMALLGRLKDERIGQVFSTRTIRTKATAQPVATNFGLPIQEYDKVDTAFLNKIRSIKDNVLIVGHSNTVDDIVNGLVPGAKLTDLPETSYDNLFIVKRRGKRFQLIHQHYGAPSE